MDVIGGDTEDERGRSEATIRFVVNDINQLADEHMMSATNTDIEEIVTVKSVHVFHLSFNANEREYELNSVIKDQNLRIFRELIDGRVDSTARDLSQRLAIIKCKDWFYPLEREKTRVFRFRQQRLCYLF
ncbi:unnamed protein product, partial [Medioppia subpectinata]